MNIFQNSFGSVATASHSVFPNRHSDINIGCNDSNKKRISRLQQSGLCAKGNDFDTAFPQSGAIPVSPAYKAKLSIIRNMHGVASDRI